MRVFKKHATRSNSHSVRTVILFTVLAKLREIKLKNEKISGTKLFATNT